MPKFIVHIKEVWDRPITIEADSERDAILLVEWGQGKILEGEFEYSHTLESSAWEVEEDNES